MAGRRLTRNQRDSFGIVYYRSVCILIPTEDTLGNWGITSFAGCIAWRWIMTDERGRSVVGGRARIRMIAHHSFHSFCSSSPCVDRTCSCMTFAAVIFLDRTATHAAPNREHQ